MSFVSGHSRISTGMWPFGYHFSGGQAAAGRIVGELRDRPARWIERVTS